MFFGILWYDYSNRLGFSRRFAALFALCGAYAMGFGSRRQHTGRSPCILRFVNAVTARRRARKADVSGSGSTPETAFCGRERLKRGRQGLGVPPGGNNRLWGRATFRAQGNAPTMQRRGRATAFAPLCEQGAEKCVGPTRVNFVRLWLFWGERSRRCQKSGRATGAPRLR